MLQSFVVYGMFAFAMFGLGLISAKRERIALNSNKKIYFWTWDVTLALLIFALVSGVRYNVGVDHLAYLNNYLTAQNSGYLVFDKEWGFDAITNSFAGLGFHFSFYFGFLAFLQIFFVYRAFKGQRYLYPFLGIIIILGPHYLSWMNGIRQMLVATVFVWSIQFITNKNWKAYFLTIAMATLIHKSAVLLLPLYFLPQKDLFSNRAITLVVIIFSLFIGQTAVWIHIVNLASEIISFIGYEKIFNRLDFLIEDVQLRTIGPRKLILIFLALILVFFSKKLKLYFESTDFLFYYNFSIAGLILTNLLINAHHIFLRPVTYLTVFSIATSAYLLIYLKRTIRKNVFWLLISLTLVLSYLPMTLIADFGKGHSDFSNYKFYWYYQ